MSTTGISSTHLPPPILGAYLVDAGDHSELLAFASSKDLWVRRVGIVGTFAFIRAGSADAILAVSARRPGGADGVVVRGRASVARRTGGLPRDAVSGSVGGSLLPLANRCAAPNEQR